VYAFVGSSEYYEPVVSPLHRSCRQDTGTCIFIICSHARPALMSRISYNFRPILQFNIICFYKPRCALNIFRTKVCACLWLGTGGTCNRQLQGRTDCLGDSLLGTSNDNNNVKVGLKRTWRQQLSSKRR
jgi:hypothetical protein